ncbi:MAG: glycosyl hydrolase family 28-related protein, partial [Bacteroidota bacterium]|nr:glycosyl hydrolase family 28-related protein [Bacteroidota bacterium]
MKYKTAINLVILSFISLLSVFGQESKAVSARIYNVKDFGARGDGKAFDSPSISKAIDAASSAGGGTVFFPAGTYICGSVQLKSNISLYLDQ